MSLPLPAIPAPDGRGLTLAILPATYDGFRLLADPARRSTNAGEPCTIYLLENGGGPDGEGLPPYVIGLQLDSNRALIIGRGAWTRAQAESVFARRCAPVQDATPKVVLCACALGRWPALVIVDEFQAGIQPSTGERVALFLVASPIPFDAEQCPCQQGVLVIRDPADAPRLQLGDPTHNHGSGRRDLSLHHSSCPEHARAVFTQLRHQGERGEL